MTTHYIIESSITKKIKVKVTFVNNTFKKFERMKGGDFDELAEMFKQLYINEIAFIKNYNSGILRGAFNVYRLKSKPKSYYQTYVSEWYSFYENYVGIKPKFTALDGKNLKQIISYLNEIAASQDEALSLWQSILHNWTKLDKFHQENTDIKYINSQLNKIITNVKRINQKSTGVSGSYAQKVRDDLRS